MERLLRRLVLCGERFCLLLRRAQAARAGERARAARGRAAGHRAAGLDDLSVQRDDTEAVAVRFGERERSVHIFTHDRARQQIAHNGRIAVVKPDQTVGGAEAALPPVQTVLPQRGGADGVDGQEGGAAAVRAFEIFDAALAVRRRVHHNGGRGRAERGVDRGDEFILGRDQRGDRAVHAAHRAALRLLHDRLDRAGKALVVALHVGQHFDAALHLGQRGGSLVQLGLQRLRLFAAALRLERDALRLVLRACKRVQTAAHARLERLVRLPLLFQPLARGLDVRGNGIPPPVHAGERGLGRGAVERERVQRILLRLPRLFGLPQVVLRRRALRGLRLRLRGQVGLPGGQPVVLGVQQLDARAPRRQLGAQVLRLTRALLALAAGAVDILPVVLDVGLQNRRAARLLGGALFGLAQLLAQAVGLAVDLPHVRGELLGLAVKRLLRLLCVVQLTGAGPGILLELGGIRLDAVERDEPQRDLEHAQLIAQQQELLCLFRLLFQRADLPLELVVQVADAVQVFLGRGELALCLLLAVAELGDAGGLLEDLAPVLALERQDLVDAALSDDGIAVAPQTCVHKQLVDVAQAAVLFVEEVFALPRAVIAAGHHDLGELRAEHALGIVQNQRDLGKADRPSLGRAAENDVLHLGAAQRAGRLLAQHPADGVRYIGFT